MSKFNKRKSLAPKTNEVYNIVSKGVSGRVNALSPQPRRIKPLDPSVIEGIKARTSTVR